MCGGGQTDEVPTWLAEVPTDAGPPWVRMGTRGLDPADWLVVDHHRDDDLRLKRRLIHELPDGVGAWEAGTEAAGDEVLDLVTDWLRAHGPAPTAGTARAEPGAPARHPLEAAALLVQEDLCLVADPGGGHRLVAGSVCFPSHWVLGEKLGLPMAAVHAPVPHYHGELERRVDTFFDRLRAGRVVVRRNLSVHDHADLHRPGPAETFDVTAPVSGPEGLWLRSERQTLRRLPTSGAVLFTIRTQVCPAADVAALPEVASRLARRVDALVADAVAEGRHPHVPAGFGRWLASVGAV